jgi:hypothetical protein
MRYSIVLFFLITSLSTILAGENDTIAFQIALGAINAHGSIHNLDIFQEIQLQKDCSIKFYLSPLKKCYMYIINHDAEGNVTLYFSPENISHVKQTGTGDFFIPPDEDYWLKVKDDADFDKFYLLVSTVPLKDLQRKMKSYSKALLKNDENEIIERKHELLEKIRILINKTAPTVTIKQPIDITGTLKGNQEDLKSFAITLESKGDIYAHTIWIIHKK